MSVLSQWNDPEEDGAREVASRLLNLKVGLVAPTNRSDSRRHVLRRFSLVDL